MGGSRPRIKVLIADDHAMLRGGLRAILEAEEDLEVVGEAADGREAVEEALRLHPDVVLMDVRMPALDGLEATKRLAAAGSRARVLVVTTFDGDEYVFRALRAGAGGFLLKSAQSDRLPDAVRTVAAGEAVLDPMVTRKLVEHFLERPDLDEQARRPLAELTEREREVLRLLARGLSNAEMGRELFLSELTVKSHVTRMLGKLGVRSRVQAVIVAYETGLVRPGDPATQHS
jgi:DNA-binding NarL/FixJ family response regulator